MAKSGGVASKNGWVLLLVILSGIVLGGCIGHLCRNISFSEKAS